MTLKRKDCDPTSYDFTVTDNAGLSALNTAATAVRCQCNITWRACVDPLPVDPCMP